MRIYPNISDNNNDTLKTALDFIVRERLNDVTEHNNLPNVFVSGRKVGKVPVGSTDIAATDRAGDINYDTAYVYIAINDSSTLTWRRITSSTW